jgi:hypothetical protein
MTDMTHDDDNSLIRLLHYANEFDLKAIVVTNQLPDFNAYSSVPWDRTQQVINAYDQIDEQLRLHDSSFPTASYLRGITKKGHGALTIAFLNASDTFWGYIGDGNNSSGLPKDSEGSNYLQQVFADPDPRPLYVGMWGGSVTFIQALYRYAQKHSASELSALMKKLYLYNILVQDITLDYVVDMARLKSDTCYGDRVSSSGLSRPIPAANLLDTWHFWDYINVMKDYEVKGNGALSNLYDGGGEGDTPALLWLLSAGRGLNDPRIPAHGSWGNMFLSANNSALPALHTTCSVNKNELTRWVTDAKADFLARLKWATQAPSSVNRPPLAAINGNLSKGVVYIAASPGSTVRLDAGASQDPNGHALSYKFWHYVEASSYKGSVPISGATSSAATVTLPADAGDKEVHIVLEVRDNGSPSLVGYRRVVIGKNARDAFNGAAY